MRSLDLLEALARIEPLACLAVVHLATVVRAQEHQVGRGPPVLGIHEPISSGSIVLCTYDVRDRTDPRARWLGKALVAILHFTHAPRSDIQTSQRRVSWIKPLLLLFLLLYHLRHPFAAVQKLERPTSGGLSSLRIISRFESNGLAACLASDAIALRERACVELAHADPAHPRPECDRRQQAGKPPVQENSDGLSYLHNLRCCDFSDFTRNHTNLFTPHCGQTILRGSTSSPMPPMTPHDVH